MMDDIEWTWRSVWDGLCSAAWLGLMIAGALSILFIAAICLGV